ncbi:hypothetical protein BJV74DRAFT_797831 [Russula compacta]|nr:hypothetical protein BJV74DRAFT_797831 [Russula compacta]
MAMRTWGRGKDRHVLRVITRPLSPIQSMPSEGEKKAVSAKRVRYRAQASQTRKQRASHGVSDSMTGTTSSKPRRGGQLLTIDDNDVNLRGKNHWLLSRGVQWMCWPWQKYVTVWGPSGHGSTKHTNIDEVCALWTLPPPEAPVRGDFCDEDLRMFGKAVTWNTQYEPILIRPLPFPFLWFVVENVLGLLMEQ